MIDRLELMARVQRGLREYAVTAPDGRSVAMGSDDRTVRVFEVPSGRELLTFGTWFSLSDKVLSVGFSSDGTHLAALLRDQTILVWAIPSGGRVRSLSRTDHPFVTCIGFSPAGELLGAESNDGRASVFRLDDRGPGRS